MHDSTQPAAPARVRGLGLTLALLSAFAYLIRMLRHSQADDSETDWELAAKAWDDLQMSSGGVPGIGL